MMVRRSDSRLDRGSRRIDMSNTPRSPKGAGYGLAAPIALALAVKVAALVVLYCTFFVPRPLIDNAATAVLGLPR